MADLQRKTANLFDETYPNIDSSLHYLAINVGNGDFTLSTTCPRNQSGACLFFLAGNVSSGASTENNGVWGYSGSTYGTMKRTQTAVNGYVTIAYRSLSTNLNPVNEDTILNSGSTALPYEPYGWVHSLRKLTTATEAVENPLYADGTAITSYTLKGNTTQSGTPTPSNPVDVQGVGNKTANLWNSLGFSASAINTAGTHIISNNYGTTLSTTTGGTVEITQSNAGDGTNKYQNGFFCIEIDFSQFSIGDNFVISFDYEVVEKHNTQNYTIAYVGQGTSSVNVSGNWGANGRAIIKATFNSTMTKPYVEIRLCGNSIKVKNVQVNRGTDSLPYEPYGYKIPISSAEQTTPIYLGEVETTRKIYKLILTGEETWYDDALPKGDTFSYRMRAPYIYDVGNTVGYDAICSHFQIGAYYAASNVGVQHSSKFLYFRNTETTLENWKQWLADQYSNGTPVIVWYRLADEGTAVVNEPLMKIGDYADTLSNAPSIPTTDGANTITVDTTVQPSEFTATWTGWHDSSVKEYDGSDWQ